MHSTTTILSHQLSNITNSDTLDWRIQALASYYLLFCFLCKIYWLLYYNMHETAPSGSGTNIKEGTRNTLQVVVPRSARPPGAYEAYHWKVCQFVLSEGVFWYFFKYPTEDGTYYHTTSSFSRSETLSSTTFFITSIKSCVLLSQSCWISSWNGCLLSVYRRGAYVVP